MSSSKPNFLNIEPLLQHKKTSIRTQPICKCLNSRDRTNAGDTNQAATNLKQTNRCLYPYNFLLTIFANTPRQLLILSQFTNSLSRSPKSCPSKEDLNLTFSKYISLFKLQYISRALLKIVYP